MHVLASALLGALLLVASAPAATAGETGLTAEPNVSIKSLAGPVSSALRQPDGKWLVAGNFSRADGVERRGIARLHPDGSLDESFAVACSATCNVEAFVLLPDGSVILGGFIDTIETRFVNGIAKVRSDGTLVPEWDARIMQEASTSRIDELVLTDDGLLVLGRFLGFGGVSRPYLARLDPYGAGDIDESYDARASVTVYPGTAASILLPTGEAYVARPRPTAKLARLAADGSAAAGFSDAAVLGDTKALAYDAANDRLYVAAPLDGDAGDGEVAATAQLGRLNGTTGAFDASWIPADHDSVPDALLLDGDAIVVSSVWSSPHRIRVLDAVDATVLSSFGPSGANDPVVRLFDRPGPGFALANFLELSGRQTSLVEVSRSGEIAPGFDPDLGIDVFLTQSERSVDGSLHLLGSFFYVDGVARNGLARLLPDGTLDPAFDPPQAFAAQMAVTPAGVFLAGTFDFVGGVPRTSFAKLDATTGALRAWELAGAEDAPGRVFAGPDGTVYAAGAFGDEVCGSPHAGDFARVGVAEPCTLDATFQPGVTGLVEHVIDDGTAYLYLAGSFTAVGGQPRFGLARVDRTTGALDAGWVPPAQAAMHGVRTITMDADHLYFTGHRMSDLSIGTRVLRLARADAAFTEFGPTFDRGGVLSLRVGEGEDRHLYVGGVFEYVDDEPRRLFVRLSLDSGALDAGFAPRIDGSAVRDVEATDAGTVVFSGNLHRVDGESRKRIAGYSVLGEVVFGDGFE